ncbi:MAG: tRNA uridine-5-carboxymethylaminomethyl(34) synthesis enzyme MnmG [Clostridiales bacterium]|nr:tRNA uridine-5-carboxymethylaminomethyl(34) synthesis enzyme MnmG [Clostridiales bacterium]
MVYDVAVVGGGHAGCEAALAVAGIGLRVIIFAINLDSIAFMPCNPNIGGSSKGHLVREIDALGGQMAKNIDKTFIQSRMLNCGKGPAVYSLRAQADKARYSAEMKRTLEECGVHIRQSEIVDILFDKDSVCGIVSETGVKYLCKAVVLCSGTYLNARCLCGEISHATGPNGLRAAHGLSSAFERLGIRMMRFKTGTPARIDKRSIDFSKLEIQPGDIPIEPFSFDTDPRLIQREQIPCYFTYTNENTHRIIRENLHRSPMYSGEIKGTGARYCPSIEDKIVRFSDKERHQLFVEPEGENSGEMYISGMSTSMPEDVQVAMYCSLPGFEQCRITRPGYAIEYDCIDATQLTPSLMFKTLPGLFSAGQLNGSSGYEEAAAQGIVAGINAALYVKEKPSIIISRSEGYIGVLIDDLVTKGVNEPYRMLTSRAEYRLLLRQDNADQRLMYIGYEVGLVNVSRYNRLLEKMEHIRIEIDRVKKVVVAPGEKLNILLTQKNSSPIITGVYMAELIRRPELDYFVLAPFDPNRPDLSVEISSQVNIQIKYEGYINRQLLHVEQFKKAENKILPEDLDYLSINGLRIEARQKLAAIRPINFGQASRITGVSPADLSVLAVYLTARNI